MGFEYAYELVAAVFLICIAVSYSAKNWLSLRANRIFNLLVHISIVFTLLDILVRFALVWVDQDHIIIKYTLSMVDSLEMIATFALFFAYFLALTEHLRSFSDRKFQLAMMPAWMVALLVFSTPWTHFIFYYDQAGQYQAGAGITLIMVVTYGYSFGMCLLAFMNPAHIKRRDAVSCLVLSLIHMGLVILQYTVLKNQFLLAFYFSDYMVVVFYLLFQNRDRFLDLISGGFSRAGFRRVVSEKYHYRERFGCLFIIIQNYQNITAICNEREMYQVMGKIGAILRKCGGKRNQFHVHGSDFAVMKKTEEELMEIHKRVVQELPTMLRINNKSIVIDYNYFILTLEEADYEQNTYFKMFSSMKKQLRNQTDIQRVMRYEGEVRREIDLELFIGSKLKETMQTKECDLRFFPVMDAVSGKCHALETKIYLTKESGRLISEDAIWSVARDLGYLKDLGDIVVENTLKCVAKEQVIQKGIRKVSVNIMPLHVASESMIQNYKRLAKKYEFPLDHFCMELTDDMSASYEVIREHMNSLSEWGVTLVLDRYGENVCNLQGIMTMPFKTVKISGQMVQRYCGGESDILKYQVQMLHSNGWKICLEGIDNEFQYNKVKELDVEYLQGLYFSHPLAPEQLYYMEEDYGVSNSL